MEKHPGTSYVAPVKRESKKILSFVKTASYGTVRRDLGSHLQLSIDFLLKDPRLELLGAFSSY